MHGPETDEVVVVNVSVAEIQEGANVIGLLYQLEDITAR